MIAFKGVRLVVETALIVLVGGLLAFAANSISPAGLSLGTDYFPPAPAAPQQQQDQPPAPTLSHEFSTTSRDEVVEMTRDPRFVVRKLLLIDARNAESFQAGHIPGALQLDPYRPAQYLAAILPAARSAEKIVIYCGGGTCEDSHFAARMLRDFGIPAERLSIYDAGFNDWQAADMPVQTARP